jgi:hypothetical protein
MYVPCSLPNKRQQLTLINCYLFLSYAVTLEQYSIYVLVCLIYLLDLKRISHSHLLVIPQESCTTPLTFYLTYSLLLQNTCFKFSLLKIIIINLNISLDYLDLSLCQILLYTRNYIYCDRTFHKTY